MKKIFNSWYFWSAALAIVILKKRGGQAADIFGAAANGRELSSTSYTAPVPAEGSVETISAIQKDIDNSLAPYKSATKKLIAAGGVSPDAVKELNDYAEQMKAVTNAILAGSPKI